MTQNIDRGDEGADEAHIHFLHEEGLELLSAYRRIHDKAKRDLVRTLVQLFASDDHD